MIQNLTSKLSNFTGKLPRWTEKLDAVGNSADFDSW